jgi:asparagine synthase (glutamine-hydrolysing)
MCGIAGILSFEGRTIAESEIEALTGALAHRGRDCAARALGGPTRGALSSYPGVALGHRRLSIIDLSPQSAQPMRSQAGGTWIVYNGELYNYLELRAQLVAEGHAFRTESDSEVVLVAYEAWGEACLARFNGMFAFAIWREDTQSLFCARDPIGIKPFYYTVDGRTFRFASESQALTRDREASLAPGAVAAYLLSMYVPRQLSIIAGVKKLLPGHFMQVSRDGEVRVRAYWTPPAAGRRFLSPEDAAAELLESLDRAVLAQLRSDVPVGALLSGGFDSGMIVASASRGGGQLHTYSVGFDDTAQVDELPIARSVAARYGTIHHERVIHGDEVIDMLDRALGSMSEPAADSAMVPTYCLSEMAASDGVKVLLSGTGGDEVFAGYTRYVGSSWRRRVLFQFPWFLREWLGRSLFRRSAFGARLRHPSLDMVMYTGGSVPMARQLFPDGRSFGAFLEELALEVFPRQEPDTRGLYEHMRFDLQVYLPDLLLMLLDQLTMAHTVEGRVPLLDVELLGAAYSLAPELHANPLEASTRRLMRRMAADRVDPRTQTGPKQGFSGPVATWIARNRERFRERVMEVREIDATAGLRLDRLWDSNAERTNPFWATEVFSLYCLATWHRSHVSR